MFKAITENKTRREEFVSTNEIKEFDKLFNELKETYARPKVIGKEGDLYSLYYDKKPEGFTKDAELYALKVNNITGDTTQKLYHRGNTSGLKVDFDVIATGEVVGNSKTFTLYHGEGVSFEEAISMAKEYTGTTYKRGILTDGKVVRVTNYKKG